MDTKTLLNRKHVVLVPCFLRPKQRNFLEKRELLSAFLDVGRTYHPLCRQAFVVQVIKGYYVYERRTEFRTCALAAAYAGAFGQQSIERPEFSYSLAVWRLSQKLGYDLGDTSVTGPTGRRQNIVKEIIELTDINFWTRQSVAEWLQSIGY